MQVRAARRDPSQKSAENASQRLSLSQTWVTLELEMRPKQHFEEVGTDLASCVAFASAAEAAVRDKGVSVESLREFWGVPAPTQKAPVREPTPADDLDTERAYKPAPRRKGPDGADLEDDDYYSDDDLEVGSPPQRAGADDAGGGGDGRYKV